MNPKVPHTAIVVTFCVAAVVGYAVLSGWAIWFAQSEALKGDVIGTWKSFAVGAFAFWIGASSGGKAKDAAPPSVEIVNTPDNPVPTTTEGTAP